MEQWKDIQGYEHEYQISNKGQVRSLKTSIMLKPMTCTNGYLIACLWKDGKQKKFLIHRLVAIHFLDNPAQLEDVNHKDECKTNNKVENLEWVSHCNNMNYGNVRKKISSSNAGRIANNRKLSINQIKQIRKLIEQKTRYKEIAKKMKVSVTTVQRIASRVYYKEVA